MSSSNRIIQDLIDEGVLKFWHAYKSGTAYDWSGNGYHGTLTDINREGGGITFPLSTSRVTIPDNAGLQSVVGTLVAMCRPEHSQSSYVISKADGGGENYSLVRTSSGLGFFDGTVYSTVTSSPKGKKYIAVNFEDTQKPEFFIEGLSVGLGSLESSITVDDAPVVIGNRYTGSYPQILPFYDALFIDRKLTATEHALLLDFLENFQWENQIHEISCAALSPHPEDPGLVAGYNMVPVDGKIIDVSDKENDGIISGGMAYENTSLGKALILNGSDAGVNCGSNFDLTALTVAGWFKCDDTSVSQWLLNKYLGTNEAWGLWITGGNIRIYDDIDNAGAILYNTSMYSNVWYHIVAVMTSSNENKLYLNGSLVGSGTNSSDNWNSFSANLYLGSRSGATSFFKGKIVDDVKVFNLEKDQAWVTAEYNKGKTALWQTAWGAHESDDAIGPAAYLENTPFFIADSGGNTYEIGKESIGDVDGLAIVKTGTGGSIFMPVEHMRQSYEEAARGHWTFWFYKETTTYLTFFLGAYDSGSPYTNEIRVRFNNDQSLEFFVNGTSKAKTAAAAYNNQQWYKLDVNITNPGVHAFYIDDVLVNLAGGSGSNPFTDTNVTSVKFHGYNISAGDKVFWADPRGIYNIRKRVVA